MPDRLDFVPNAFENRPNVAASGPQYATDATKVMENYAALAEGIGCVLIDGRDCDEGTVHYGSSDSTHCRITVPDDRLEVGDILILGEGSRVWQFELVYDREIEIEDADLIAGTAGTNNYDTIKDSLHVWVIAKDKISKTVTKDLIQLSKVTGGKSGTALTAADLQISETDTDKVGIRLEELETDFGVDHNADGTHKDDVLDQDNFLEDGLYQNGFQSAVKNGFFRNYNPGASSPYYPDAWDAKGSPSAAQYGGSFVHGGSWWQISAASSGDGIEQTIDEFFAYAEEFDFECWVRGTTASGSLTVEIYDGVTSTTQNQTVGTTWTRVKVHHTLDASATEVTVRVYSEEAGAWIFRVARCVGTWGNVRKLLHEDVVGQIPAVKRTITFFIASGDHAAWTTKAQIRMPSDRAWRITDMSAYALTQPAGGNQLIRIYDGATIIYVQINNGANWGYGANYPGSGWDLAKRSAPADAYSIDTYRTAGTGASGITLWIEYLEILE
jgi:hypothetical protein